MSCFDDYDDDDCRMYALHMTTITDNREISTWEACRVSSFEKSPRNCHRLSGARLNNVRTCVVTTMTTDSLEPYYTRVDVEQLNNRVATPPPPFSFNHRVVIIKGFHNSHRDGAGAALRIHCSSPSHLSSFLSSLSRHFHSFLYAELQRVAVQLPTKAWKITLLVGVERLSWKLHKKLYSLKTTQRNISRLFALRWSDIKDSRQQRGASQHTMKKRAPSYTVHENFSFIAAAAKVIKSEDFKECS